MQTVETIHNLTEQCALCLGVSTLLFGLTIVLACAIYDLLSDVGQHRANYRKISSRLSAIEEFYATREQI